MSSFCYSIDGQPQSFISCFATWATQAAFCKITYTVSVIWYATLVFSLLGSTSFLCIMIFGTVFTSRHFGPSIWVPSFGSQDGGSQHLGPEHSKPESLGPSTWVPAFGSLHLGPGSQGPIKSFCFHSRPNFYTYPSLVVLVSLRILIPI